MRRGNGTRNEKTAGSEDAGGLAMFWLERS
jgi:hypothetical protein